MKRGLANWGGTQECVSGVVSVCVACCAIASSGVRVVQFVDSRWVARRGTLTSVR